MRLDPPPRRLPAEPYLPLINIVFLLLIFFLIAAQLAPAAPLRVTVPQADGVAVAGKVTLYLSADGTLAHDDARGDAALPALAATRASVCGVPCDVPLLLHVDRATPARQLAQVMVQVAGVGWRDVQLVTARP